MLAAVLTPAIVPGVLIAEDLRRRNLRWTCCAVPAVVGAACCALWVARAGGPWLELVRVGRLDEALVALAGLWVSGVPLVALGWLLWRDRRDRLHGGHAERRARLAQGPLERSGARRALQRARDDGRWTGDGILLGVDETGWPVRVPSPLAHTTIVGGSNTGKTNTAALLLEAQVVGGGGFVVLDGKGGLDLPRLAASLGTRHGRPVALWSLTQFASPELTRLRRSWNPLGAATPTEAKDRVAAAEEQTEPYYAAIGARGLLCAGQALVAAGNELRMDSLARLLDDPGGLGRALEGRGDAFADDARWLRSLNDGERSALRGIAVRLRTMVASDGGPLLLPDGPQIQLEEALRDGWLVVFSLPQGLYPALVPHITRYVLAALSSTCAKIEGGGVPVNAMVFVDELSAFDGDQLSSGLERGRSAGVRFVVATQSLSNFETAGGEKLLHAALDNAELLIIHRQAVPDSVELLASLSGTEEAWEHTHQIVDGPGGRLGLDESGDRARRLTDRFVVHPNDIKRLGQGEGIVIAHRAIKRVRRVRIDLARHEALPAQHSSCFQRLRRRVREGGGQA